MLRNFYTDLKQQDKEEIALKKLKGDGHDSDGLREGAVRKQLKSIIKKYEIDWHDVSKDVNEIVKQHKEKNTDGETTEYDEPLFRDKKLGKLWKKAQKADLTEDQLKLLKEELRHYEEKMAVYHRMAEELSEKKAKERELKEDFENHIEATLEGVRKELKIEETADKLKAKHGHLKEEYRRLAGMVSNASVTGSNPKGEFQEEAVNKLWNLALRSDFNDNELSVLRDDLLHYQTRLRKLAFFKAELESDKLAGKKGLNELTEDDDATSLKHHEKHIVRKVKELAHKVGKIHADLENRILQRHSEL